MVYLECRKNNKIKLRHMKKIKETTIDELAIMIQKGFESMDNKFSKKFEGIDKKFEGIDKKFEGIDKKFESIDKKFEGIDKKFEGIDKKFEVVHEELKKINIKLDVLERGQEDLKLRQDNVPYRFELKEQEETLDDHDKRIRFLERKVLLTN